MAPALQSRLLTIQLLRILAATAVVFQHSRIEMSSFDGGMDLTRFDQGALGVDLFFVISGFIMVWVTETHPREPLRFIVHRFLRVWPLYFAVTIGAVCLAAAGWFAGPMDFPFILKSLFLIPSYRPELGGLFPFVVPGWSLILEVGFYTLFGLGLFSRNRYSIIFVLVAVVYLVCSHLQKIGPFAAAYGGRDAIFLEFLVGMLVAIAYVRGMRLPPPASAMLLGLGTVLLVAWGRQGLIGAGLACGLIVLGAVNFPFAVGTRVGEFVDRLGRWSFALYLIHVPVIQVIARALHHLGYKAGDIDGWLLLAFIWTVSLLASKLLYDHVETRAAKWLKPVETWIGKKHGQIGPAQLGKGAQVYE